MPRAPHERQQQRVGGHDRDAIGLEDAQRGIEHAAEQVLVEGRPLLDTQYCREP